MLISENLKFSLKSKEFKILRNPHTTRYEPLSLIERTSSLPHRTHELSTSQHTTLSLSLFPSEQRPSPWHFFFSLVSSSLPHSSLYFFSFFKFMFVWFWFHFCSYKGCLIFLIYVSFSMRLKAYIETSLDLFVLWSISGSVCFMKQTTATNSGSVCFMKHLFLSKQRFHDCNFHFMLPIIIIICVMGRTDPVATMDCRQGVKDKEELFLWFQGSTSLSSMIYSCKLCLSWVLHWLKALP